MKEINGDYILTKGEQIRFKYSISSFYQDSQIQSLIEKITEDGRLQVDSWDIISKSWYSLNDILTIDCTVIENPFPLAILIVAIASIAVSIFLYLSLDKVYLISESSGLPSITGISFAVIALLGFFVYSFYYKR